MSHETNENDDDDEGNPWYPTKFYFKWIEKKNEKLNGMQREGQIRTTQKENEWKKNCNYKSKRQWNEWWIYNNNKQFINEMK